MSLPRAIEAKNLAVAPQRGGDAVLENINLCVPRGCRAALVGANGTGKSTLLRTLAGLVPPRGGCAFVEGAPVVCGNPRVAYLAQRHLIEWHFPVTVRQMVLSGRYARLGWLKHPRRRDHELAWEAMRRLGLEELAGRPIHALSGGQKQRVLIARALCQEAAILLLDEPFTALDAPNRKLLERFLNEDPEHALTVVMATHELADVEEHFDLVLKIQDGCLHTRHACTCDGRRS